MSKMEQLRLHTLPKREILIVSGGSVLWTEEPQRRERGGITGGTPEDMSASRGQKPQALRWLQRESLRKSTAGDALNTQERFAKSKQLEHGETILSV